MTKEKFVKTMENIQTKYAAREKWVDKVAECFGPNSFQNIYNNDFLLELLDMIELEVFKSEDGWLEYAICECKGDFSEMYILFKDKPLEIKSWEEYYDFLKEGTEEEIDYNKIFLENKEKILKESKINFNQIRFIEE